MLLFKNSTKNIAIVISLCLALFAVPAFANAESHSTTKTIAQWGLNGGLLFSVTAKVSSVLGYSTDGNGNPYYYNYNYSDANISLDSSQSYGLSGCGDTVAIRKQTNMSGVAVSLPTQSTYIVPTGTTIIGYHTSGYTFYTIVGAGSASVDNYGVITPNPSKCTGGGGITDSFTISH